jgi:hypothetical protein
MEHENESKEVLINIIAMDKDSFSSDQLNINQNDFNELYCNYKNSDF